MCHTAEHCDALDALEGMREAVAVGEWYGSNSGHDVGALGWQGGLDMYVSKTTPRAARLAAGGVVSLAERVCAGELDSGFAIVRPPGHHACTDRMCGFCFLNGVAIAARAAVLRHGLSRVLIVDWDVHHGNAHQNMFWEDPDGASPSRREGAAAASRCEDPAPVAASPRLQPADRPRLCPFAPPRSPIHFAAQVRRGLFLPVQV